MRGVNWEVGSTWYADKFDVDIDHQDRLRQVEEEKNITLLSTCRSAIAIALSRIGRAKKALIPSFTCHSVVSPFVNAGYEVKGYPLENTLEIDLDGLSALVDSFQPDVILIHGYFGFDTLSSASDYLEWCKSQGIIVIEDKTQNMFSTLKRPTSNFAVGSIRKWLPVPDGAFLTNIKIYGLEEDTQLADAKIDAMEAKHRYIMQGNLPIDFMSSFIEAEKLLDDRTKPYAISGVSFSTLHHTDENNMAKVRRENYNVLAERINTHPELKLIFQNAPEDVVPFQLPIYVPEGRSDFQKYMAEHKVYPTVIWRCPEEFEEILDSTVRGIYDEILCFHIDQRYDMEDMNKVGNIIDSYFNQQ